jgi:hypothetical protein
MRQPLDHARNSIFSATILCRHLVADIHNIFPILGGQILVSCLSYRFRELVTDCQAAIPKLSCPQEVKTGLTDDIVEGVLLGAKHGGDCKTSRIRVRGDVC